MKKDIYINPDKSKLFFQAYNNFFSFEKEAGQLDVWFQPPLEFLKSFSKENYGIQIQSGQINTNCFRGNHYHTDDCALDFLYLQEGKLILGLESLDGKIQEFYCILSGTVCILPSNIAHTVWNKENSKAKFTTFKSWNYSINSYTTPYKIKLDREIENKVKKESLKLVNGVFGISKISFTSQII